MRRLLILLSLLPAGCGSEAPSTDGAGEAEVVLLTTIAPFEAILQPLLAGRAGVEALLPIGASPHTYDPRPSDVRRAARAVALVYGADDLDGWAARLEAPAHIVLLPLVPAAARLDAGDDDHHTVDPHFWTDPLAVRALLPGLVEALCRVDPPGCATYRGNAVEVRDGLGRLHQEVETLVAPVRGAPVLLSHPFFRYFLSRYGLYLVGVVEPSPGKEPSPRALQRLVRTAGRAGVAAILTQSQLPDRSAAAVAEAAGIPMVQLDPIGGSAAHGSYRELILHNARLLREELPWITP